MALQEVDASTQSSERQNMEAAWSLISDISAGARVIRSRAETYLPKYEGEDRREYDRRLKTAPWRPEFTDTLRTLASKPFDQDVALKGDMPERIRDLAEDIDGRGNSLTRFAAEAFEKGIGRGLHAILVDFPTMAPNATLAEEREANARPYWIHIPAERIVALYTAWVGGREIVEHFRFRECAIVRDGFGEKQVERIRVYEPGRWEVWEQDPTTKKWFLADGGEGTISRGQKKAASVPVALFFAGERTGEMRVKPPLLDVAELQIELYQALSRQDEILTFASSPMLTANGLAAPGKGDAPIMVGPKAVLFAPPGGSGNTPSWDYINPDAANIKEVRDHTRSIIEDIRRLGMQPLTRRSGTATATGEAIGAAQAHSVVQAWALGLKDVLEQAWVFTCEWMAESTTVECHVNTDFSALPYADAPLNALDKARARRDISLTTYWDSLKRLDCLAPDFDPVKEEAKIKAELATLGAVTERDPATGRKIDVETLRQNTGAPTPA